MRITSNSEEMVQSKDTLNPDVVFCVSLVKELVSYPNCLKGEVQITEQGALAVATRSANMVRCCGR